MAQTAVSAPTWEDEWKARNPFTNAFVNAEIAFYGLPDGYAANGITIASAPMVGRVDDYLNKNFRIGEISPPVFRIDGRTWMSLTPMEIQSAYLALLASMGRVATIGLGMGYFTLRAMARPEVESVDVYEIDQRVIDFFTATFKDREGFDKVRFHLGDYRDTYIDQDHDFLFMDPYPTLLGDDVPESVEWVLDNNYVSDLMFWGREKVLYAALLHARDGETFPPLLDGNTHQFFSTWMATEMDGVPGTKLANMADRVVDAEYVEAVSAPFHDRGMAV